MVRDLVTTSIRMVQQEKMKEVYEQAQAKAEGMILDVLVPQHKKQQKNETLMNPFEILSKMGNNTAASTPQTTEVVPVEDPAKRRPFRPSGQRLKGLAAGKLEDEVIEIDVDDDGMKSIGMMAGMNEDMSISIWQYLRWPHSWRQ